METNDIHRKMEEYLETLTEKERKAYHIAKEQLGMSFDLKKSNGFIRFVKQQTPQ